MSDEPQVDANIEPNTAVSLLEKRLGRYRVAIAVLLTAVVFLVLVVFAQLLPTSTFAQAQPTTSAAATEQNPPPEVATSYQEHQIVRRQADDPLAIGAVDAPVVLVNWTDLRCPYCALFYRDTLPQIIKEYVDTGMVRIEIHDVAFFGEQSNDAAVAAQAAAKQGYFAPFIQAIYDAAPESGHADLPREQLISFARQVGVPDIEKFTADLDDPQLHAAVSESTTTAQSLGINSVPFFVAGSTAIAGAQPLDTFRSFLDQAIALQAQN